MDTVGWLFLGMAVPANGFPLLYLTFYRWWQQPIGRALMTKAVGLALIIDVTVLYTLLGDYPCREVIRNTALALVMLGLWYQFVVFLRIRLETRKRERSE